MWFDKYAYAVGSIVKIYFRDTNLDFTNTIVKLHNSQIMNITYMNASELCIHVSLSKTTTLMGPQFVTVSDGSTTMMGNIYVSPDSPQHDSSSSVTIIRNTKIRITDSNGYGPGVRQKFIV